MSSQFNIKDTIVALATPPGTSAIGVIRLSGKHAITICNKLFKGKDLTKQKSHTIHYGSLYHKNRLIDDVLISIFKEPKSYTGENVVEVSCHGSTFIQQEIIKIFIEDGARMANPGEFTLRAFLNGKFDLAQAEAVADLIASYSNASHQLAIEQMRGVFSSKIKSLRTQLIDFASLIELELDFSQEDVEFANRKELKKLILKTQNLIQYLIKSFELGNVIKNGVAVAIAGKPNVGKSTLLNLLLHDERAIVSEIAGTTRDYIEDQININGILFRFIDTAGIRDTHDSIEQMGVKRAIEKIKTADIVIYLFDVSAQNQDEVINDINSIRVSTQKVIIVGNKTDLHKDDNIKNHFKKLNDAVFISAKQNHNIEKLINRLISFYELENITQNKAIVSNVRHFDALQKTNYSLNDVIKGIDNHITTDMLAIDVRSALYFLGEITGDVTSEDVLKNIFSRFCIGK